MDNEIIKEWNVPVLPLRGLVMFPSVILHFDIGRKKSVQAIEHAMKTDQYIFMATQKDIRKENPDPSDIYSFGILGEIKQILHQSGDIIRVLVEGKKRGKVIEYIEEDSYLKAIVEECNEDEFVETQESIAIIRKAKDLFEEYLVLCPKLPPDLVMGIQSCKHPGELADYMASNIMLDFKEKQELLAELDPEKRLAKLLVLLINEIQILSIENTLAYKLKETINKNQKEYYLKEQMRVISQELGEEDDPRTESEKYKKDILALKLEKDSTKKLIKECERLSYMPPGSSEANVTRSYLDTCIALPWNKVSRDNKDLSKSEEILEEEHFGLKKVKERIIEILAVRKLCKGSVKGQIICLAGPPGVGKTSVAKSVAHAMGRKYVRISLGGVRDESEVRGHRRTYIGAMPGRIMTAIKQAGVRNPLILLDEIDKLCKGNNGDPSAALLEALDPEQNKEFYDHYIDVPFNLSDVLFMTTANDVRAIPRPLLDRMEIINLYSYTHEEKFNIAKRYLVPKQMKKNGVHNGKFNIDDDAIRFLIDSYTKEAGVRELERNIAALMRKTARIIVSGESKSVDVDKSKIIEMLGPEKYKKEKSSEGSEIGVVTGLAWTSVGGETMPIEVVLMKGKGKLQLTGSLGDVMKESAQIAVSYIRSHAKELQINPDFYNKMDIHIHAPEGAVPKDGPSAGVTMTTAIVSALSNTPVKRDVAMTGEVTLRGKLIPIGGLKEKTMAAYRAGIKTVIIPSENEKDLYEIDDVVKDSINFVLAKNLDTVFQNAFDKGDADSK